MCAEPGGKLKLIVQLVVPEDARGANVGVSFNGCWPNFKSMPSRKLLFPAGSFTDHSIRNTGLNFEFNANLVKEGWNSLVVMNCGTEAVEVVAVELGLHMR